MLSLLASLGHHEDDTLLRHVSQIVCHSARVCEYFRMGKLDKERKS